MDTQQGSGDETGGFRSQPVVAEANGDQLCREGRFYFFWGEIAFRSDEDDGTGSGGLWPGDGRQLFAGKAGQTVGGSGRLEQVRDIGGACRGLCEQVEKWGWLGKRGQPGLLGL